MTWKPELLTPLGVGASMPTSKHLGLDPQLLDIQRAFSAAPVPHPHPAMEPGNRKHAAVSLILRGGPETEVLLVRRAESAGDPWSGHMALPGGRRDDSDTSLLHTAMRETLEETGLDLEGKGTGLGSLKPLEPNTTRLPPISIFPYVFGVPEGTEARVASPEIVEVLWVPLSYLSSPEASSSVNIPLGDLNREFPCFRVGKRVIWGLTYRILEEFFRLTGWGGPHLPPTPQ